MSFGQLLILGALAGFTIFLGLPIAAINRIGAKPKAVLTGVATGILLFLAIEILSKVLEAGEEVIATTSRGETGAATAVLTMALLVVGIILGLVGIPLIEGAVIKPLSRKRAAGGRGRRVAGSGVPGGGDAGASAPATAPLGADGAPATTRTAVRQAAGPPAGVAPNPASLSLAVAAGIGLHNFGEGLAIGQSAASGAVTLAVLLVVGFGLHNMTEGFGVAAPLSGTRPSGRFLLGAGLIAGGPTFIGTLVGSSWTSQLATVIFLSLAGGSLVYVTIELLSLGRNTLAKVPLLGSIAGGFFAGYLTDLIVSIAGA